MHSLGKIFCISKNHFDVIQETFGALSMKDFVYLRKHLVHFFRKDFLHFLEKDFENYRKDFVNTANILCILGNTFCTFRPP